MVVADDPERAVWIDFDRAETYDADQLTSDQEALLEEEEEIVVGFRECLVSAPAAVGAFVCFVSSGIRLRRRKA